MEGSLLENGLCWPYEFRNQAVEIGLQPRKGLREVIRGRGGVPDGRIDGLVGF